MYVEIETADIDGYINNMETWKYCKVKAGDVRLTAYSDGRIEFPYETHYRDIGNVVSCLIFILQWGERIWE
jgi:hypothetical protein